MSNKQQAQELREVAAEFLADHLTGRMGESSPVWSEAERRIGSLLMSAWSKAEKSHGVTLYPTSYEATFRDMARAVLQELAATAAPVAVRLTDEHIESLWYPTASIAEAGKRRVAFGRTIERTLADRWGVKLEGGQG